MAAENLIGNVPNKVAGEYQRPLPRDIELSSNGSNAWKDETGTYSWDKMGVLPPCISVADFSVAPLTEADGNIYIGTTDTTAVHADWDSANKYDWVRFTADTSLWSSITPSEGQMCYDTSSNTWYTSDTSLVGWLELQSVIAPAAYTTLTLPIENWDMDAAFEKNVSHGLSATEWLTIRKIDILIQGDAPVTSISPIGRGVTPTNLEPQASLLNVNSVSFYMIRLTSGSFDGTGYDSTSDTRGWITFDYTPD